MNHLTIRQLIGLLEVYSYGFISNSREIEKEFLLNNGLIQGSLRGNWLNDTTKEGDKIIEQIKTVI